MRQLLVGVRTHEFLFFMKILDIPQSGKLGMQVRMPGRYGAVARIYGVCANPQPMSQMGVRRTFARYAQSWAGLTVNQRMAWNDAAKTYLSKARLGQSGPLTGCQLFTRLNCNLVLMGASAVVVPPQAVVFPALVPSGFTITNTLGVIKMVLTCGDDPTEYTVVSASGGVSPGRSTDRDIRVLGECPQPVLGKSDITAMWVAKFGVPVVGRKVFVSVHQMIDGFTDIPAKWDAIVPVAE